MTQPPETSKLLKQTYRMVLFGTGLTGCVTVLVIGAALALGFWLDRIFASENQIFTIGLIILSVPLTLVALLWVVRTTTARYKQPEETAATPEEN